MFNYLSLHRIYRVQAVIACQRQLLHGVRYYPRSSGTPLLLLLSAHAVRVVRIAGTRWASKLRPRFLFIRSAGQMLLSQLTLDADVSPLGERTEAGPPR